MINKKIKYSLIFLGFLDLVSFFRTYKVGINYFANFNDLLDVVDGLESGFWYKVLLIGMPILSVTLLLMLLTSGILLILGKKAGIIVYYFEFPLRFLTYTLTFGFMITLLGLQVNSMNYKLALILIVVLELVRLVFSIWTQRNYFGAREIASP